MRTSSTKYNLNIDYAKVKVFSLSERHNENTIVSPRKLKEHLELVRKLGYAVDDEEATIGLCGIGAPILDSLGQAVASISVSGTTTQITPENLSSFAEKVKQTGIAISQRLGFDLGTAQVQSRLP
jgi:IclR family transcriptional regulator, KDG regulon repressor